MWSPSEKRSGKAGVDAAVFQMSVGLYEENPDVLEITNNSGVISAFSSSSGEYRSKYSPL